MGWWLIGNDSSARLFLAPGTVGFRRVPGSLDAEVNSFTDFAACDAANRALAPIDFDFAGGKLAVWLRDDIYGDNTAGQGGKNPSWKLSRLTSTCP